MEINNSRLIDILLNNRTWKNGAGDRPAGALSVMEGALPAVCPACQAPGGLCRPLLGIWGAFCPGATDLCPFRQLWSVYSGWVCKPLCAQVCVPVCRRAQSSKLERILPSSAPWGLAPGRPREKRSDLVVFFLCFPRVPSAAQAVHNGDAGKRSVCNRRTTELKFSFRSSLFIPCTLRQF